MKRTLALLSLVLLLLSALLPAGAALAAGAGGSERQTACENHETSQEACEGEAGEPGEQNSAPLDGGQDPQAGEKDPQAGGQEPQAGEQDSPQAGEWWWNGLHRPPCRPSVPCPRGHGHPHGREHKRPAPCPGARPDEVKPSMPEGEDGEQTIAYLEQTKQAGSGMIVLERTTNRVLMGENETARLPMASLTKIMTAVVAIENCQDLDAKHAVPKEAVGIEGSSIYLVEGEELSVRELLYGLMLRSGNDSAEALAVLTGGSTENFVRLMNDKAAELGLKDTKFQNPSGLSAKDHYTSCYDLAMISSYAMQNELFRTVVSTKQITISNSTKDYPRVLKNKNKMLWEFEGGCGIKTGYTKEAGRCLVSAAERDGLKLVCVVLNCGPMWEVSKANMQACFDRYELRDVLNAGQLDCFIQVTGGLKEKAGVYLKEDITLLLERDADLEIEYDLPETLAAPLEADQIVGEVRIYCQKELLFSQKIYNIEKVEIQTQKIFEKIFGNWSLYEVE